MRNHRILFVLIMLTLCLGLNFTTYGADSRYRIAVLPFDDGSIKDRWWGGNWDVGAGVSDELVTALLKTGNFRLVEREQIQKILHEQDFGASGRVDSSSAAKIGKILGVHFLVMGRVTEFAFKSGGVSGISFHGAPIGADIKQTTAKVAIDARLVDATSAEITAAVTGRGEKKNTKVGLTFNWNAIAIGSNEFRQTDLGIALRSAVESVATQLSADAYKGAVPNSGQPSAVTGLVADYADGKVYINIGTRDGVQNGMVFVIHHVIRLVKDPQSGEVIDEVTEPVAEISVASVKEKSAVCLILNRLSNKYPIAIKDLVKQKM